MTIFAQLLPAQSSETELRIRLESTEGARVSGALVALVDSGERVVVEGVSSEGGTRTLSAPPGTYRVRVRRIGFLPYLSAPVSLPHAGELVVPVESARVALQSVIVTSRSGCGPIDRNDRTLSLIWDEIAKALRTTQLNARDFESIARYFVYRSRLSADASVVSSDTTFFPVGRSRPFGVRNAAVLAVHGYVLGDERTGWVYYAPDETVLLSEQFAATHCFRAVRDNKRSGEVGIEFKPASGRKMPEIAGTLWVDEGTAELRELVFRFVNAGVLEDFRAGGNTRFRRVSSGWIVSEWSLRAPILIRDGPANRPRIDGYSEDGGGLTLRRP
ncbi:MAG TPA: carboxypeptidase-like regulatory domain-containing protein [Gemmatimonadaceae bacterium]|nr:carboxypeptidase-like regulatory domain-containing protein [Gemmatimonadaceae bacterium]